MRETESIKKNNNKSEKNKTIDITLEEGELYFSKCINITSEVSIEEVTDKTINGDTLEVMGFMPKEFIDLLIVDPPYNLSKNYHGNFFDKQSTEKYKEFTRQWILKVIPLLKKTASIYICCDWESSLTIGEVLHEFFYVQNRITWQREKGRGAKTNWKNAMEDIWFATVSKDYVFNVEDVKVRKKVIAPYKVDGVPKDWEETEGGNFRNSFPSNFWDDISIPYWSMPENTAHPTQKPEKLLAKLILASSNKGDIVFDPFLGSGSTSVTAKKLGRHYVGIEMNKQYCAWSELRLEKATFDKSIQGYSSGVFWERNTLSEQQKESKEKFKNSSSHGECFMPFVDKEKDL
jgi:site-specific DNA-methyltransferase (adenine-specific)